MTLPRLELMGALLAARLAKFVKEALRLPEAEIYAYSDSTIALHWIKGDVNRYNIFITNRVNEIKNSIPKKNWFHCPGSCNPADLASRGTLGGELIANKGWLNGPQWMELYKVYPQRDIDHSSIKDDLEVKKIACMTINSTDFVLLLNKFSNLNKLVNVLAYIFRFFSNCKSKTTNKQIGTLTSEERETGQRKLWCILQQLHYPEEVSRLKCGKPIPNDSKILKLDPYFDTEGILRINGRLQNSKLPFSTKHPIIVPNSHIATLLIRFYHNLYNHSGLDCTLAKIREKFWIVRARRAVKSVIKYCLPCQRINSRPLNQISPPLPEFRIVQNRPFAIIGIDYAGPLFCKGSNKKWYILLITCGVVRALHLELAPSLNLKDFLDCFSKFTSRRKIPEMIVSDNATTFVSADKHLSQTLGPLSPTWKFIAPRSPWWGGWYERLVRSVKTALKKTICLRSLSKNDLEIVLYKIENSINHRPKTRCQDQLPLRPVDFLHPFEGDMQIPDQEPNRSMLENLQATQRRALVELFERWRQQYIVNLPHVVPKHFKRGELNLGDLVIINESHLSKNRLLWPLGRIVKLHPSRDDLIRSVDIQTEGKILTRTVQRLHKMELSDNDFNAANTSSAGRLIK